MDAIARRLRRDQTLAEKTLWNLVRNRRLSRFRFLRQHPIKSLLRGLRLRGREAYCGAGRRPPTRTVRTMTPADPDAGTVRVRRSEIP
ncbi:DUF559 domain-containing protein [Caulobacter sp.]|uniref:DUF559 domain-containing protein n=1 Tax=Caulobacter sp. TaxID=78 RepID=UPI0039C8A7A8